MKLRTSGVLGTKADFANQLASAWCRATLAAFLLAVSGAAIVLAKLMGSIFQAKAGWAFLDSLLHIFLIVIPLHFILTLALVATSRLMFIGMRRFRLSRHWLVVAGCILLLLVNLVLMQRKIDDAFNAFFLLATGNLIIVGCIGWAIGVVESFSQRNIRWPDIMGRIWILYIFFLGAFFVFFVGVSFLRRVSPTLLGIIFTSVVVVVVWTFWKMWIFAAKHCTEQPFVGNFLSRILIFLFFGMSSAGGILLAVYGFEVYLVDNPLYNNFYLLGLYLFAYVASFITIGSINGRVPAGRHYSLYLVPTAWFLLIAILTVINPGLLRNSIHIGIPLLALDPGKDLRLPQISIAAAEALYDFDRDGFSILGKQDCNDLEYVVNPLARELPANGIDDNCNYEIDEAKISNFYNQEKIRRTMPQAMTPEIMRIRKATRNADILFISFDASRPDHMSLYGYERDTTPNLKAWAESSAWIFERAYTPGAGTFHAMTPMIFSRNFWEIRLASGSLMKLLEREGYETHLAAKRMTSYLRPGRDDFNVIHDVEHHEEKKEQIISLLDEDPDRPPRFVMGHFWIASCCPHRGRWQEPGFGDSRLDAYDEALRYQDEIFGSIIKYLQKKDVVRPTIVAFFSDHGDEYLDHGGYYHGHSVYYELVRVPLVLSIPGTRPEKLSARVSLLDIVPSVLDAIGISQPIMNGVSLIRNRMNVREMRNRPLFMMGKSDYAALDGEWYLVYRKGRFFQLFNEDRDPKHQSDIARRHRTVVRKMAEKHMAFFRYAFHLQRRRIGDADIHLGKAESLEKRGAPKKEILFHLRKYFLLAKDDPGLADERAWVAKWVERLQSGHQDE